MPELDPVEVEPTLEYIVDYLQEAGPTMGDKALTFGELTAFCVRTGVDLDDFESTALKQMSAAYLGMTYAAQKHDCPCPAIEVPDLDDMAPEDVEAQRAKVAKGLAAWFGAADEAHGKPGMKKKR